MLIRVFAAENLVQDRPWIVGPRNRIQPVRQNQRPRELAVSSIPVAEAQRTFARDVAEENVGFPEDRHRVEEVERPRSWQITLDDITWQTPVLPPLHVDSHLRPWPGRVKYRAVPVGPDI